MILRIRKLINKKKSEKNRRVPAKKTVTNLAVLTGQLRVHDVGRPLLVRTYARSDLRLRLQRRSRHHRLPAVQVRM